MGTVSGSIVELRRLLGVILSGSYTAGEATSFVNICHRFAAAYIRVSGTRGVSSAQKMGISTDQLAFDSIADLFARDAEGRFREIERYYGAVGSLSTLSDDQIVSSLRRLIFSAVKNHRYRTFQEHEPWLARISRNIKLALKDHPRLVLLERHGLPCVRLHTSPQRRQGLPELPPEFLQAEFFARGAWCGSLRKILDTIACILTEETAYADALPLPQVCELVRTAFVSLQPGEVLPGADTSPAAWELRSLITGVVNTLKAGAIREYVRKGKFTEPVALSYCAALAEILEQTFCAHDGDEQTYCAVLQKHLAGVDNRLYDEQHRSILEYLAKTAKTDMRGRLKAELGFLREGKNATRGEVGGADD